MSMYNEPNQRDYKPVYNDDRDYSTNAPTYYDYLADVNNTVQQAYNDISNIVEGDIIQSITSDNEELLKVTKKNISGKTVSYTLTPLDKDTNITTTTPGVTITKHSAHTFEIDMNGDFLKTYLVDGSGVYSTLYNGKYNINIDFTKVQSKLTAQDGVKMSGSVISTDWNKVQKALHPDNKSIIIDGNGNITAQVPYDRLEAKIDKWRTVGNVAGSIHKLSEDVQPTTVNPSFLKKSGEYFYLSRAKSDNAVWGGTADSPTNSPGFLRVTSTNYNNAVLQEFYPINGDGYYFRIGSELQRANFSDRQFWGEWRAVFNDKMYDRTTKKYTSQKGIMWGQGYTDSQLSYNAGRGVASQEDEITASDLSTLYTMKELFTQKNKVMLDKIRFGYDAGQIAGDCHTGSNIYYKIDGVNLVNHEATIVAHSAVSGVAISKFVINHEFFSSSVMDMTVANDRIYFINTWCIFWFSLNDYSTGYIDFSHQGYNTTADGKSSTIERYLRYKGISYYNDKLYVLVQEDYKNIAGDGNGETAGEVDFAIWEITLNTNGTGSVSDKCLFKYPLTGSNMKYLQVINNCIYVGYDLDRLFSDSAQNAYGEPTTTNQYDACGLGVLGFSMKGEIYENVVNVKAGLQITGLGHNYIPVRKAELQEELGADGCIMGYNDQLLVSGYQYKTYTGVVAIEPYVNNLISTVLFSNGSKISYNSSGTVAVTSQFTDTDELTAIAERTAEFAKRETPKPITE